MGSGYFLKWLSKGLRPSFSTDGYSREGVVQELVLVKGKI